jgi:hypothetical protein
LQRETSVSIVRGMHSRIAHGPRRPPGPGRLSRHPLTLSLSPSGGEGIGIAPSPSARERGRVRVAISSRTIRGEQSPAPARLAARHPKLNGDEPATTAFQARRLPHPPCPILHLAAGGEPLDARALSAHSRAHRATHVVPDLSRRLTRGASDMSSESGHGQASPVLLSEFSVAPKKERS